MLSAFEAETCCMRAKVHFGERYLSNAVQTHMWGLAGLIDFWFYVSTSFHVTSCAHICGNPSFMEVKVIKLSASKKWYVIDILYIGDKSDISYITCKLYNRYSHKL